MSESRKMCSAVDTAFMGDMRNARKILVRKLGRCRWEDNIRIDSRQIVWRCVD
jgi:hypothetical protein